MHVSFNSSIEFREDLNSAVIKEILVHQESTVPTICYVNNYDGHTIVYIYNDQQFVYDSICVVREPRLTFTYLCIYQSKSRTKGNLRAGVRKYMFVL